MKPMTLPEIQQELYMSLESLIVDLLTIDCYSRCRVTDAFGADMQQAAFRLAKTYLDQHAGDVRDAGRLLLHYAQKSAVSE